MAIPAAQGHFGAVGTMAPGSNTKKPTVPGAPKAPDAPAAPGSSAVSPTSIPTAGSTPAPNVQRVGALPAGVTASPTIPAGYRPSVNRNGTIPEPAMPVGMAAVGPAPAGTPGIPAPSAPSSAPATGNPFDLTPQGVLAEVQSAFQAKHGRAMTAEEQEALIKYTGFTGQMTPEIRSKALASVQAYSGNLATPFGAPTAAPAPSATQTAQASADGWQTWLQSRLTGPQVTLPTTPLPTYTAAAASQYQDPVDAGARDSLRAVIDRILANPESLDPATVAKMKEAAKESTLSQSQQLQGEIAQGAASRGTYGSGNQQANMRRNADATTATLAKGNRDIDIHAATTNMADRRAAAGLGDSLLNSLTSRAGTNHAATMDSARFGASEGEKAHGSQVNAVNHAMDVALAQAGLDQNVTNSGLQAYGTSTQAALGQAGLGLDKDRLAMQGTQFDKAHNLDWIRVLNDMVMGRAGYGLNLAQLQQGAQSNMFDWFPKA